VFVQPRYAETITQRGVAQLTCGHITVLLDRIEGAAERDWYAAAALEHGWTRDVLTHQIAGRLHARAGSAPSNFTATLPAADSELAQHMVRDPYLLDFLDLSGPVAERDLEAALMDKLQAFLLELGHGFAFVGRLVLCGNHPYAWDSSWSFVPALCSAMDTAATGGMQAFVESLEASFGERAQEPVLGRVLANDPLAIAAAWRSAMLEGSISGDLAAWSTPCLIYMAAGEDMYNNATRAAAEIPNARFLRLEGHTHLSAPDDVDAVLPSVLDPFRSTDSGR
jgi:predicted nuclease of restriction endonuclease-like (RecB) superfamily